MPKLLSYLTLFLPKTPYVLVYMLQQVEYQPKEFQEWLNRWPDYRRVMRRQNLIRTGKAWLLILAVYTAYIGWLVFSLYIMLVQPVAGIIAFLLLPFIVILLLRFASSVGYILLQPARRKTMNRAAQKMRSHPGLKIAVLGSYGKTTMKEILATVLAEGKKIAVSPGNMNVAVSHARWINHTLTGKEDVIIFEFGEFRPGDIARLAELTNPDEAIITGVAPNHLKNYRSYDDLKADIASIGLFVAPEHLYADTQTAETLSLGGSRNFDDQNVLGWRVSKVNTSLEGTVFTMVKGKNKLTLQAGLVGQHLVLPLAFAAAYAHTLGLTSSHIKEGVAKTKPFPHRMQPVAVNGAWIIDDTYNGNIEGMRAGLDLLKSVEAKRKIYVTPGLVEQGIETVAVHTKLGKYIAQANPDEVVLMQNSAEPHITASLIENKYPGIVRIIDDPLVYYQNLHYTVAAGDVVLLQNDWTDNYN